MLSYCSNVVAAENMSALEQRLATVFAPARELAGVETLGVGLWLPARTMAGLADDPAARRRLAAILAHHGLAVVTMNAFPYGSFHGTSVKHAVYRPDWTTPERIAYTRCCAEVLSELLGDMDHGTISTLPLGWAEQWSDESEAAALRNLSALGDELRQIEEHTGRRIRLAIEPEPGCVIGSCRDAIEWFGRANLDPRYLGLCLDTCHLAVMHETPGEVVSGLAGIGVEVVKIQASNAIQIDDLADERVGQAFAELSGSPYLHQVNGVTGDGQPWFRDDLSFADPSIPRSGSARVHYHVPLHLDPPAPLRTTSHILAEVMTMFSNGTLSGRADVEVETYTWEVLPASLRKASLAEDIAGEIGWLDQLLRVGDPA